jgi:hypothetical protein
MVWTTIKTVSFHWEAELIQQVLLMHEISVRIVDLGVKSYMGQGSPAALQVHTEDEQAAHLLLSTMDEVTEAFD